MTTKRKNIITLVTALSVCVGVWLLTVTGCRKTEADKPEALDKDISATSINLDSKGPDEQANPKLAARIALEKSNRPDLKNKLSGPERIKAHHKTLQISDEDLVTLSTDDILDKVTSSSLAVMMLVEPDPDAGLKRYAGSFNGVNAFLGRPDAAKVLLNQYARLCEQLTKTVREKNVFCFTIMEVLMSSNQIMDQRKDTAKRKNVVSSIIKCLDAREEYDSSQPEPVYGKAMLGYSTLAIAKYLEVLGYPEYRQWYAQKRETGLFVRRRATRGESEEIISMARKYEN